MLLAIDPGACTGWALFDAARRLKACGATAAKGAGVVKIGPPPDKVLIECAQLRGRGEKNPNSILLMARVAGEWAGRYSDAGPEYILPVEWKGTTPKDIDHRRTFSKLAPEEIRALVIGCTGLSPRSAPIDEAIRDGLSKADKRANVLDAIGIGLFGVGRGR